jgi:hypothetical protein
MKKNQSFLIEFFAVGPVVTRALTISVRRAMPQKGTNLRRANKTQSSSLIVDRFEDGE